MKIFFGIDDLVKNGEPLPAWARAMIARDRRKIDKFLGRGWCVLQGAKANERIAIVQNTASALGQFFLDHRGESWEVPK